MKMKHNVKIKPRFQRAIRIDSDLGTESAIKGFICPKSSSDTVLNMCHHIKETGQGAFTWTGPYGSGKSSLVVALGSLLSGNAKCSLSARNSFGPEVADKILNTLPPQNKGWRILPVVGRRESPVQVVGEALLSSRLIHRPTNTIYSDNTLVQALLDVANSDSENYGGLIVFIDEMGKFLESAARDGSDIYMLQLMAEAASRSNNRLIIIGILHQSFEDYAHRLSREIRDEWSKIQGRFIDLPINVAGEEQIDLLSRAITAIKIPSCTENISIKVAQIIKTNKKGVSSSLSALFNQCWPLHPVVACILGSISRRRFGQNQRSIFGFLNSAEPYAFQDFLTRASDDEYYTHEYLWEYLRTNLEPSILSSPDGHRWSLAVEAIDRCDSQIPHELHIKLLKTIALIDLFKGNTGLIANFEILEICYPQYSKTLIQNTLEELRRWSYIIYRAHLKAYSVYAGSDFDIDEAVSKTKEEIKVIDFQSLKKLAGLQPILAKRHYHSTGTLRWFNVELVPLIDIDETINNFSSTSGTIGQFVLVIPTENESQNFARDLCIEKSSISLQKYIVLGLSKQSWTVNDLAIEILATEKVFNDSEELGGDSVARREVKARLSELQGQLEVEISRAFDHASWYVKSKESKELTGKDLSILASCIADEIFKHSPKIFNELLNRIKPSSNAVAAQNILLKRMVVNDREPRLGIIGYPAEGGLFSSLLEITKLYDNSSNEFISPNELIDPAKLFYLWDVTTKYLENNSNRTIPISNIYDLWRKPPYGVRDGLMPVLIVAYLLSESHKLAYYREGIFQSRLKDLDIEILVKDANAIQIRYVDLPDVSKKLLSGMADIVRKLDPSNMLCHLEPIDVARGLVSIFDSVHPLAQRTLRLSQDAIKIRNLFKKSNDPNKFLFDDIPGLLGIELDVSNEESVNSAVEYVYSGLKELKEVYDGEVIKLRDILLAELQVPNTAPQSLAELRARADNVKSLSGDFHLEAFIVRLSTFTGTQSDTEGIASLATSKPPKQWVDNDVDKAKLEITMLAQKFIRTEAFARVKGRVDKRQAISVIVGINGRPTNVYHDFDVVENDRKEIHNLINKIDNVVKSENSTSSKIKLAALAELCAIYIDSFDQE